MISSGELKPGDQVPSERSLMERFSVGRPAVREALKALHNQGLITISHGERSRVNELSAAMVLDQSDNLARLLLAVVPANLEQLKQARQMFEMGIVRAVAAKATTNDVEKLKALYTVREEHLERKSDISQFIEADMAFHNGIAGRLSEYG